MMVNKTANFKRKGKSKKKGKSMGASVIDTPWKSNASATPDVVSFFCNEKGRPKRNYKKYLKEQKKSGKVQLRYMCYTCY
jgi:hypothetical protein